jgi:hypothetical protein
MDRKSPPAKELSIRNWTKEEGILAAKPTGCNPGAWDLLDKICPIAKNEL